LWDEYRRRLDPFDTDSDGDGMNDGYEVRHGLDAASAADRDLDPDGDTLSNLVEAGLRTDPRNRDSDGDGMPDDWEVERGLDPLTLARGQGGDDNLDGDPAPNLAEFVADTDPTNAASFLFVAGLSPTPVRVHFASSARRLYTLRYATNLAQGVWEDLSGQIRLRGTGGAWWMEDTSGATSRFYRVRVEVP
jgi:hypothetical protein